MITIIMRDVRNERKTLRYMHADELLKAIDQGQIQEHDDILAVAERPWNSNDTITLYSALGAERALRINDLRDFFCND